MSKTNKKQIFCTTCLYQGRYDQARCLHPNNVVVRYRTTPRQKIQKNEYIRSVDEININNDCPDYLDHDYPLFNRNTWKNYLGLVKRVVEIEYLNQDVKYGEYLNQKEDY